MKEFDWDKFKEGNIAIYFNNEKEAKDFLLQCDKHNIKWSYIPKDNPNETYFYLDYKPCYCFDTTFKGLYQYTKDYFIESNYIILNWRDYMKNTYKTFTKDMLKDGMVVEFKNGILACKFADKLFSSYDDYYVLKNYNSNLNHYINDFLNIIKVYSVQNSIEYIHNILNKDYLELIWERKEEPKEMTLEEIEKELGHKVKIVNNK